MTDTLRAALERLEYLSQFIADWEDSGGDYDGKPGRMSDEFYNTLTAARAALASEPAQPSIHAAIDTLLDDLIWAQHNGDTPFDRKPWSDKIARIRAEIHTALRASEPAGAPGESGPWRIAGPFVAGCDQFWYVTRVCDDGMVEENTFFSEAEAIAVRDALNRVASTPSEEKPGAK